MADHLIRMLYLNMTDFVINITQNVYLTGLKSSRKAHFLMNFKMFLTKMTVEQIPTFGSATLFEVMSKLFMKMGLF